MGETCDGWTVDQRYRLKMAYDEGPDQSISTKFVTWERRTRSNTAFNQKDTRNGNDNDEIRGETTGD